MSEEHAAPVETETAPATAALGIDAEQHQQQDADADAAGEKPQPPAPPPEPAAAPTPLPLPAVPSTRKRPSKHAAPPKPILRPPGSSHTASHNALITGVAAATASLLPTNAKPALASFLQNINTRLAQGGVGVQVPIPHGLTPTPGGMGTIPGQGLSYVQQQQQSSASSSNTRQQQQQSQQQQYTGYGATSSSGQGLGTSSAQQGTSASALLNGVLRRFSGAGPSSSTAMGGSSSGSATPTRSDGISIRTSGINSSLFHTGSNGGTLSPVDFRSQSPSLPSGPSSQQQQQQQPSIRPLRRVQFRPTLMTVTYPIVNTIAPADEDATRRRVESEHRAHLAEIYGCDLPKGASASSLSTDSQRGKGSGRKKVWNVDEVEELYTRCCRIRQEWPLKKMRQVFQEARQAAGGSGGTTTLRTLDLSTIPLDQDAVDPLADFLSVDFGLDKLVLENCMLTDEGLKAFLHALLISGTLPNLSLASNKKIKAQGWKYVALFIRRAQALRYLDLSENVLNKAALGEIVAALERAPRELVSPAGERRKKREEAAKVGEKGEGEEEGKREGLGLGQDEPEFQPLLDEIPLMPAAPLLRSYDNPSPPSSSLSASTPTAHYSQLSSLRLENCSLKTSTLELLAQGVRASELRHLSLRRNKISNAGASALALVLKDYPDVSVGVAERLTGGMGLGLVAPGSEGGGAGAGGTDMHAPTPSYAVRSGSLPLSASGRVNQAISTAAGGVATVRKDPRRTSYLLSPTESEALSSGSEAGTGAGAGGMMMSPVLPAVPEVISSPQGGVTSKRMNPAAFGATMVSMNGGGGASASSRSTYYDEDRAGGGGAGTERDWERSSTGQAQQGYSGGGGGAYYDPAMAAEQALAAAKAQRAFLANLPRVGALLTLDLKSNDIGSGVVYLAQALKKNRTLRVLNLSDCNIDMAGLIAMADMLKYNATLETLDLSHNQCCGPSLEGITTLRTAFTLNSGLKRLFLSDTELSSEGAICLAEFLPEAKSLIHLDLTENYEIDIAGVMALAVSLRMNTSLRCLDLNVPPNNHEFSRLSQEILQSCVRNTEEAQRRATQRGLKQPVAAPIYRSAVARAAKAEDAQREREMAQRVRVEGLRSKREKRVRDTLEAAGECAKVLMDLLDGPGPHAGSGDAAARAEVGVAAAGNGGATAATTATGTGQEELLADLLAQSKRLRERLAVIASNWKDGKLLARTLHLNDELDRLATRAAALQAAPTPYVAPSPALSALDSPYLSAPDQSDSGLSSPSFSIGSDDEDDEPAGGAGAGVGAGVIEDNLRRASQTLASSSDSASTLSPISSRRERVAGGEGEGDEDEEEEEDEDDLVPRPSSSSSSSATRQLPSLTIDIDGLEAEKIEPPPEELQKEVTPSPAEHRAKGQLSEEGEIFRKAKSLMLVDESGLGPDDESESDGTRDEEEVDEGGVEAGGSASGSGEAGGSTTAKEDLLPSSSSPTTPSSPATSTETPHRTRQRNRTPSTDSALSISSSGSGSTAMGGPSSHHAGDAVLMIDPEVSGERLRKEILEADVPRVHRYPGGGADAAAAAETSPNAVATDA
ncbi:unnamed protein product [Tilletia controversa]|nr:hypothetical protein CF328_g5796 [Tilletia controversa]CAD6944496.1 unnamed protein product [Tilletia controversa]CAD6968663.1 unnamed protein product [Tilletia controversa]